MTWEYCLEPLDETKTFPQQLIVDMKAYLKLFPSYVFSDGTFVFFKNVEDKNLRVPMLLANPQKNSYLEPTISIHSKMIVLSCVGNPNVDHYLYEFVLWCKERWPCQLYDGSEPVSPEELIAEP
ncbi:MAG: hypothetical protein ACFBSE_18480 [Prochloraceae cyanobacterium]